VSGFVLYCVTVCILVLGVVCCVCFFQQCCVYGKNRKKVPFSTVTVLYCVTVCIVVFALECFAVSNVEFIEGTDRE